MVHAARPVRERAVSAVLDASASHIGLQAFNHAVFRAAESGVDGLSTARTLPMMAPCRLVEIRDLEEGTDAFFAALIEYLADPSPSTIVVLSGSGFPKVVKGGKRWSVSVRKAVGRSGGFSMDPKASPDPVRFVRDVASGLGKRMDAATARAIVERIGPRFGALELEVDKLVAFVGDAAAIERRDVESATAGVAETEVWGFTASIVARQAPVALATLQRLQADGQDSRYLLAMVSWKIRGVLATADALRAGVPERDAARLGKLRPNELRQVKEALRAGLAPTDRVLSALASANLEMNRHRAGDKRVFERLVLDLVRGDG